MHDVRAIRHDPTAFDAGLGMRGLPPASAQILAMDEARRESQTALQKAQARRKALSSLIGRARAGGESGEDLIAEVETLKARIAEHTESEAIWTGRLHETLSALPNLPAPDVPMGADEQDNREVRRWGEPWLEGPARDHADLGVSLGMMNFEAAASMSGARFVVLESALARLERALGQFMIDIQTQEHGYREIAPPLLVRDHAVFGAGQLPKFADDLFRTTDDRWLISTAEVPLTNLVAGRTLAEEALPLRLTALTPCFRSEAGASGRDTKGMIRQHQFYKVELVSVTTPERSQDEHERMLDCAESILRRLELPFRTVLLCSGDMGFAARKTFDLEVWLPSQRIYREISSCSNCGDFQARRLEARCKAAGEKGTRFVHTLNGSGLAVGRTLVAIMENYQDESGAIVVPQALHPYMRGITRIEPDA
jgi:seryl-tRNA synthetase